MLFYFVIVFGSLSLISYMLLLMNSIAYKNFIKIDQQTVKTAKVCPVKKVGFLKTHKCASTSIQNIMFRYGLRNNLNFVFPRKGFKLGNGGHRFKHKMISNTLWDKAGLNYSIFALHTGWNYKEVSRVLNDQGDVSYISMIRDPIDLFVSAWDYTEFSRSINEFVMTLTLGHPNGKFGLNQMLRDFGVHLNNVFDRDTVMAKIKEIEETFHLIMVAERFEDSIILMRNELCWTYEDVANFKLNAKDPSKKSKLTDEARKHLKQYLWPDYLLYNHFIKIFKEKYQQLDPDIVAKQKAILKNVTENLMNECILKKVSNEKVHGRNKVHGRKMIQYLKKKGSNAKCKFYIMREWVFCDHLRMAQLKRAKNALNTRGA